MSPWHKRDPYLSGQASFLPKYMKSPQVTVIIPTYNERENIVSLVSEIEVALLGVDWSIIFVDDNSSDGTILEIERAIRLNKRIEGVLRKGVRGLSGAVLTGLIYTRSPYVAVMDADLQHNPNLLKKMLHGLETNPSKQVALASRYLEGGGDVGDGLTNMRHVGSRVFTKIAQLLIAKNVTDPMSGFFMVRRELFLRLSPKLSHHGYKILLDLVSWLKVKDVILEYPLIFRVRKSGESKMDFRVVWECVVVLISKSTYNILPKHFLSLLMVGLTGLLVHLAILFLLFKVLGESFAFSQILATAIATLNNFLFNNFLTCRGSSLGGFWLTLFSCLKFLVICGFGVFVSYVIADYSMSLGAIWIVAGCFGAIVAAGWNYSFAKFLILCLQKPEIVWLRR